MSKSIISKLSIVALVLTLGLSVSAQAENSSQKAGNQAKAAKKDFSDKEKKAFVAAYKKVSKIQNDFRKNISQKGKKMKKDKMKKKARAVNKKIETTIDSQDGMDTKLYRQFLTALKTDKSLLQDIKKRLQN